MKPLVSAENTQARSPSAPETMWLLMIAAAMAALSPAMAAGDDGSWGTSFRESAGPIYAQTPNADIALESELLRFSAQGSPDGTTVGVTEAVFMFRNTADREISVEAGFPIKVGLSAGKVTKDHTDMLYLTKSKYESEMHGLAEAQAFYGEAMSFDKKFQPDEYSDEGAWLIQFRAASARKKVSAKDFEDPFNFSITQDGNPVGWDWVLLESKVTGNDGAGLDLGFHFHHVLTFKPKATSVVKVTYAQDVTRGGGGGGGGYRSQSQFGWDYVLGTGGTWKGAIGKLLVCVPTDTKTSLPKAFQPLGIHGAQQVFLARDYKPAVNDGASLQWTVDGPISPGYLKQIWFDDPVIARKPTAPAQDFVKVRSASTSLPDKVTVYTPQGVIKDMDFQPLRLFDGILESAWVEGATGDGTDEWVKIELTRDVLGMYVQNGFSMARTHIEGKNIDSFYEKNNRVESLVIESMDGKFHEKIELEDTNARLQYIPLAIPRGIYKFIIHSIYKGSKWDDTGLGEITFLPSSDAVVKVLGQDAFLQHAFSMPTPIMNK
jgi:hypothetical protein